jgi:hypothetical protein
VSASSDLQAVRPKLRRWLKDDLGMFKFARVECRHSVDDVIVADNGDVSFRGTKGEMSVLCRRDLEMLLSDVKHLE